MEIMNKKAKNSPLVNKNEMLPEAPSEYISSKELTITEARKLLPENLKHLELNPREYKFLAVYCSNNFDAVEAVEKAGYVERTHAKYRAIAYSLLQRKEIVEGIRIFIDTVIQPYKDRLELELLNIYYRRATYDIATFVDKNNNFLPIKEIDKEWRCCIDGIKNTKYGFEYTLPNRDLALQALYKFVTGQDMNTTTILPEEAQKKMKVIFNNVLKINANIKPKNIKRMKKSQE
jgi:hypothetical protein